MEISEFADRDGVEAYFKALLSLANYLVGSAIGNQNSKGVEDLAALKSVLDDAAFLSERSRISAEAPRLIAIAAGAPGHVEYFHAPGLHERDRQNPEITMSVEMAAEALSRIGMTRETFTDPAKADCALILQTRDPHGAALDPAFFRRPLWPENTPWAVKNVLVSEWRERMSALGLRGLVHSFDSCQDGLFPTSNKPPEETRMANHITINLADGSTWNGPVTVGRDIQVAYQAAASSGAMELATALTEVVELSAKALEKVPDGAEKETASSQLKTFVEEAKADKPKRWLLEASSRGLVEILGKVAGTVAPVATAIAAVLKLVND
ncbi:hypothetical protein [Neorhizobium sp. T7_12]|uniref:hypothetical protein n=1 Tax=Neorhizobium sp. T7_12 TaxID=2093832 RepID=UPI00155F53C2|nr:hypothetical protein [Neorhizobium sp. T7_12]